MKVDLYESCPCGSGKKIKFCCKDLAREIDGLMKKIEGKQIASARAQLEQLLAEQPDRECWLAIKATLQLQSDDLEGTQATLDHFLKVNPKNSIALAVQAMVKASTPPSEQDQDESKAGTLSEEAKEAIEALQSSLENCGDSLPVQIYDAVGAVGQRLMLEGHVLGAREHFVFQAALSPDESAEAVSAVMQIDGAAEIPLLLKQDLLLDPPPEGDTPWKEKYERVFEFGQKGQWGNALALTREILGQHPDEPFMRRAQGVLACRLGNTMEAVEGWRGFAQAAGTEHDAAVKAEALAQVLAPLPADNLVDMIEVTYEVKDADAALERLQSDERCLSLGVDFSQMSGDGPPPKGGFAILDREMPESVSEDVAVDELPQVVTQALLYGKETDRPARILYSTYRGEHADEAVSLMGEILGEKLADPVEEKTLGQVPASGLQTRFQTQLPQKTAPATRSKILRRVRTHILINRWTKAASSLLDGKTPEEASQDDSLRIPLEAAIVVMETTDSERESDSDFMALREALKLPAPAAPGVENLRRVPLLDLLRVDAKALDDDHLRGAFVFAMQKSIRMLIVRFGREVLSRESFQGGFKRDDVLGVLARYVEDPDEALDLVHEAQKAAVKRGESPANWKLTELGMRLSRQEATEFQALLGNIQTNHIKEPGVQQKLIQLLARFGLIRPTGGQPPAGAAAPAQPPAVGVPTTGPDISAPPISSEQPASGGESGEGKSKLWLPGME